MLRRASLASLTLLACSLTPAGAGSRSDADLRLLSQVLAAPATVSYSGVVETVRVESFGTVRSVYRIEHRAPDLTRRTYSSPPRFLGDSEIVKENLKFSIDAKNHRIIVTRSDPTLMAGSALREREALIRANYRAAWRRNGTFGGRPTIDALLINKHTNRPTMLVRVAVSYTHLWTQVSGDGNGVFQVIPWWRSTRIDYLGDLPLDVLGVEPDFSICPPTCAKTVNLVGLDQGSFASYVGVRASDFRATKNHAWKIGVDLDRESATASQEFACFYVDCASSGVVAKPYYPAFTIPQGQAGSNIGIYGEDKWQMTPSVVWSYGLRYDHSTGYVGGDQISPRIGVNIWDGGKNVAHVYYGKFYAAPLLEDVRQACVLLSAQQACSTTNPVYDLKPESDSYYERCV